MPKTTCLQSRWPELFPPAEQALPSGILAAGGNLNPQTLLAAYSHGIFPWYSENEPILWWCPDPRCVFLLPHFSISRRSSRKIRSSKFLYSCDTAFEQVIAACGDRPEGTWLLPEMQSAYIAMYRLGYAHSVEIWQEDALVGGLYGIALGNVFFGESMFRRVDEASRAALCILVEILKAKQFVMLDCQEPTPHVLAMGARNIPRKTFLAILTKYAGAPSLPPEIWRISKRPLILH